MTAHSRRLPRARLSAALALGVMLAGCTAPEIRIDRPSPEGRLTVMSGGQDVAVDAPPEDWLITLGDASADPLGRQALSRVTIGGVDALELFSSRLPTIAVREIDAMMLATPYLKWSWHMSDHGQGIHPIRLVVGFQGGLPEGGAPSRLGSNLPPHDRALALVWSDTMLRRGAFNLPPLDRPWEAPLYTVRGGRENARNWHQEVVDLADLYAKAWPDDDRRKVRVAFIGMAAAPHVPAVRGRVANILLHR